ncbi:hypothetical protein KP509_28G023400 [Ceratopteris richardii]|uniref:Uncharacterized protein n=1 Tax=Ceratopteris richardii TaxID=49495 RepID=A0A8T2RC31_CERRI|nr:hypothetical protein KP509_28G023400 [Ceratopteris richardii]
MLQTYECRLFFSCLKVPLKFPHNFSTTICADGRGRLASSQSAISSYQALATVSVAYAQTFYNVTFAFCRRSRFWCATCGITLLSLLEFLISSTFVFSTVEAL